MGLQRTLVEDQIVIVAQEMIRRDATAGCGTHHSNAIGTFEIRLDRFIVSSVAMKGIKLRIKVEIKKYVEPTLVPCSAA